MKKFRYKAKNPSGKTVSGLVEAVDEKRAVATLRERGLVTFGLNPIEANIFSLIFTKTFRRVTLADVATFTRQLASMITAGLTINEALTVLRDQASLALSAVIDDILRNIEGGSTLAGAMAKHPRVFSQIYIALIRTGEAAGVLDTVLVRLADNLEKQREFRSKVKGAMIYPIIVVIGMMAVATVMMIFVVPKLMSLYEEFQATLPTPTLVLMKISQFFVSFWWLGLIILVGAIAAFGNFRKTPFGRRRIDEIILRLPIFGKLQTQIILTEVTRTLGLLVGAGVSIIEALNITADAAGNAVFEERLNSSSKQVEKGLSLGEILSGYGEFPPIVPQMVSIGEETGKMDDVLAKLSRYFEQESEQMVKGLTTAIEPLIMIVLGIGVGFLIIAIILPIYNLTSQFQ